MYFCKNEVMTASVFQIILEIFVEVFVLDTLSQNITHLPTELNP